MPVTIQIDNHPVGYCVEGGAAGEMVRVCPRRFLSSEDGEELVTLLEGLSNCYREAFERMGVHESEVSTFLAVARPDKSATVYINELRLVPSIRLQGVGPEGVQAGTPIMIDHIADIDQLELQDSAGSAVQIPSDCGVSLVLSHRWRKGFFFDYSVFGPHARPRTDDLSRLFGHFFARLLFQEVYSATDAQWSRLFELGWFPFVGLRHEDRKSLLTWARSDRLPPSVLYATARTFVASLDQRLATWAVRGHIQRRMPFLTQAKERLDAGDYLSCINLLYPQIEGVMRGCYVDQTATGRPNQGSMVDAVMALQPDHSLLLPTRFAEYLRRVYFRDFNERVGNLPLSRHTVSHGVSDPADYDFQRAAIAFMVLDQLFFYLSGQGAAMDVVAGPIGPEGAAPAAAQPPAASPDSQPVEPAA